MNKILRCISKCLKKNIYKKEEDILYQVGNYSIFLPSSHKLPEYQKTFSCYDKKLKYIIRNIGSKSEQNIIIDIGANVGDTAAYIRSFSSSKIYCIEGDSVYLGYLRKNIQNIPNVEVVDYYISGRNRIDNYHVVRVNGTAKLSRFNVSEHNKHKIKNISLEDAILKYNINPTSIELIKIDTDGFDFDILIANKELISKIKPDIFFEYDISFNINDFIDSIELIDMLQLIGYNFIVYDNFGNLLLVVENNAIEVFTRLNHYLSSCKSNGGGVFYFDIFASVDKCLIHAIVADDNII